MLLRARIYRKSKPSTQSGQAGTHTWVLEYGQNRPRHVDSLMGWTGCADTPSQVRLQFPDQDSAVAYATEEGIPFDIEIPPPASAAPKPMPIISVMIVSRTGRIKRHLAQRHATRP